MVRCLAASLLVLAGVATAEAQTKPVQKVTPPEARYWMGATTGGGMMSMMGLASGGEMNLGAAARMAMGGMPEFAQTVELRLGSSLSPTGGPEARHTFPKAAQVNQPIFLQTLAQERAPPGEGSPYERPKGRVKFFWGCGEKAPKGQPVVLDFEKLASGIMPDADLGAGIDANEVRKPTRANSRTYGDYPNNADQNRRLVARFQPGTSLAGEHLINGTYTPDIRFTAARSFMEPVRYSSTAKTPGGAVNLAWAPINRATGYSLAVIGGRDGGNQTAELVLWSSSAQPATFIMHEDLAPSEVARLIKLKAVLAPTQTSCAIPAEVIAEMAKAGGGGGAMGGGMLAFTAFGDQETFIHPPRPADPKVTWDQEWFARISYKSIRMDAIGAEGVMSMDAMMAGGGRPGQTAGRDPSQMSDEEYCRMLEAQRRPSAAETLGSASGIPGGGMLGRALGGRKKDEPKDPRCQ
jgi:hypothetical protein